MKINLKKKQLKALNVFSKSIDDSVTPEIAGGRIKTAAASCAFNCDRITGDSQCCP